ncbi:MAG: hypothetical protein ACI857_000756 [Arenicella sp.]|jgi:hypothetical protein
MFGDKIFVFDFQQIHSYSFSDNKRQLELCKKIKNESDYDQSFKICNMHQVAGTLFLIVKNEIYRYADNEQFEVITASKMSFSLNK